MKAKVKNWEEHQHYKDRCPPWIKLHRHLLDDFDWARLPVASRALAPMLWLLAAEDQGEVNVDPDFLAFRLRWDVESVKSALKPLISGGWLILASNPLADCYQDACLETETETETERETEEETETETEARASAKRARRLADDWELPEEYRDWTAKNTPQLDPDRVAEVFRDYWIGRAGAAARKRDWFATWRNWCRKEAESAQPAGKVQRMRILEAGEQ